MDLKIGQTVYVEPIGNAARRSLEVTENKITEIGRKYFKIDGHRYAHSRFHISSLHEDGGQYISDYRVWLSKQDLEDDKERKILSSELSQIFRYGCKLPLEKLRQIKAIINH